MSADEDEDLVKNAILFIALRVNKDMEEKKAYIETLIDNGADVNAVDANNINNTPIHIAVKKSEIIIIQLLIDKGAHVIHKNRNGKTPLDIAMELQTENKQEIINILEESTKKNQPPVEQIHSTNHQQQKKGNNRKKKDKLMLFPKRAGTSGVSGQLYETKLLSLVLLRASNDKEIEDFYLATNIRGIGALDDLCFKYKIKGEDKSILLFLQAKHRDDPEKGRLTVNDVRSLTGDFCLAKYLDSFLRIKERFDPNDNDPMFKDEFNNVEPNFVIYTPAKDSFDLKLLGKNIQSKKIHELINTSENGVVFQFKYCDDDVDYVTNIIQEERVKLLGHTFLEFIMSDKEKYQVMMTDELIRKYHVVLAEKVIQVFGLEPEGYRMGKFRTEFFRSHEHFLVPLRDTLYRETVENHCKKPAFRKEDIMGLFKQLLKEPSPYIISKVIGNVVTYDDKSNKLDVLESNLSKSDFNNEAIKKIKEDLRKVPVTSTIINRAIELAGETKLQSIEFKLPACFGNEDLTVRGNDNKVEKRLDFLASKFKDLFKNNQLSKIIEINDHNVGPNTEPNGTKLEYGILEINGGIGGAVGNLLVLDGTNRMLQFNTKHTLPEKAGKLLEKFRAVLPKGEDIANYRIKININGFPRISFHGDEYDRSMAKDFLNRLWFYTSQAKEDEVENILKKEINKYYNAERGEDHFVFRIHSDAIFLRFHDEIQKWWMISSDAPYLTNKSEIFDLAKKDVIDSPLLTVLNFMYINKIKKIGIEFSYDAVKILKLDSFSNRIINVVTDANILSGIKIKQYFKNVHNYSFIDFDYVLGLPLTDYNTMLFELQGTQIEILIIVYEPPKTAKELSEKLKLIITKFKGKKVIIVTDQILGVEIKHHFVDKYLAISDEANHLNNFTPKSQKKILEDTRIVFQGHDVSLNTVIQEGSQSLVKAEVIWKLINNEKIEIGHVLTNSNYNDVKDYYVDRHVKRQDLSFPVNNLQDIDEDIVLIAAKPGMGKSTLLTHLSVETRKMFPSSWIARINFIEHAEEFNKWQQQRTHIDSTKALTFLCKASLRGIDGKTKFELVEKEGDIVLEKYEDIDACTLFELKLFIDYYNNDKITFLFYGFDYVCPPFEKEVIKLLKIIESAKKRMWVTSNCYKHATNALEREFGILYTLEPIDEAGQTGFFQKFFKTNLKLEQLNNEMFSNIRDFLQYMAGLGDLDDHERQLIPLISMPLHLLYISAVEFFQSELINISSATVRDKLEQRLDINLNFSTTLGRYLEKTPEVEQAAELAGTPLHMYIAANYFEVKIKDRLKISVDTVELKKKWDLLINTVSLYERFLRSNLEKLCFETMGSVDDESVENKKREEFIMKHKKLALLAICKEKDLEMLLSKEEINEMKNTIAKIQLGEEKSSVVDCVLNDVPRYFHLVFAEYFAIEFLMDLLKATARGSIDNLHKHKAIWDFLVNIFLFTCPKSVRNAFDYKLKHDPELVELTSRDSCSKIVFDLLLKKNEAIEPRAGPSNAASRSTALDIAVNKGLSNLTNVLLKSIQDNLNEHNVNAFVEMVKKSAILLSVVTSGNHEVGNNLLECIKNVDRNKLQEILKSDALINVPVKIVSLCGSERVADNLRDSLTVVRDHLAAESHNLFGLSDETVNLIGDVFNMFMK